VVNTDTASSHCYWSTCLSALYRPWFLRSTSRCRWRSRWFGHFLWRRWQV